jgi:hypothetical protein
MTQEKTLIIAACAVGAYLLLSRRGMAQGGQPTTAAQRLFARSSYSPAIAGPQAVAQFQNRELQTYAMGGRVLNSLFGRLTSGTPNVAQQANAAMAQTQGPLSGQDSSTGDPYSTSPTSVDAVPGNPPGMTDLYDYSNNFWP